MFSIRKFKQYFVFGIIIVIITACNNSSSEIKLNSSKESVNLFAASGSRSASEEICDLFEEMIDCKVNRIYSSSGILARQIYNGAKGDVYISANKQWIAYLADNNILIENSIKSIAENTLVVIAPAKVKNDSTPILFTKEFNINSVISNKIAIGDPAYVPVGKYTKSVFDSLGWYNQIKDKIIMAKDVSSVLRIVELGECNWGIVYFTEALQSDKVKIIAKIPEELYPKIEFFIADIKGQQKYGNDLSKMFCDTIGQVVLKNKGFHISKTHEL